MKRLLSLSLLATLVVAVAAGCTPAEETVEITPLDESGVVESEVEVLDTTLDESDELMYEIDEAELEEVPADELD